MIRLLFIFLLLPSIAFGATNITGVTFDTPTVDPNISPSGSFSMCGTIVKAGGGGWAESGDMYWEWDQGTATWATMGSTGALNVSSGTNPLTGLQDNTQHCLTVYNDGTTGTFQVRITLIEDDLTTYNETAVTVDIGSGGNNKKRIMIIH